MKTKIFMLISLMLLSNLAVLAQKDTQDTTNKNEEKLDWRKVKIVNNESNVLGMKKVQEVKATTKGDGQGYQTPKTLERSARIVLRKKAAQLNANYILLTDKNIVVAFGENPSATLYGVAYTDKKKSEKGAQMEDEQEGL